MKRILGLTMAAILACSMLMTQAGAYSTGKVDAGGNTIYMNGELTAMVDADGGLWVWGGFTDAWHAENRPPQKIMDNVASISMEISSLAAVKKDGSLWIWEDGNYNLLAPKQRDQSRTVAAPKKIMDDVVSVSLGCYQSCAVKKDGSLWMWGWGSNSNGEFGVEGNQDFTVPFKVMDGVSAVSVGYCYTLALKEDHTLWSWGKNDQGQLGNGTTREYGTYAAPAKIMDNVAAISAGCTHAAAIREDGSLWMWGTNSLGELGNGGAGELKRPYEGTYGTIHANIDGVLQPNPVRIMDGVTAVSAGENVTAAVKTDGSLWMWGVNEYGQLGKESGNADSPDTTTSDGFVLMSGLAWQNTPVKVIDNATTVHAGRGCTLAVRRDGAVWGWGSSLEGQLRLDAIKDDSLMGRKIRYTSGPVAIKGLPNAAKSSSQAPSITAAPTASKVLVDGAEVSFDAYTINQNNYFKLRDLACVLSGTEKQFEVAWNGEKGAIELLSGQAYTPVGGELAPGDGLGKTPVPNTAKVYLDGTEVRLTAYTINGNNYFKLRDLGQLFDFGVSWDGAVVVDTGAGYAAG